MNESKIKKEVLMEWFHLKDIKDLKWLKKQTPEGEFVPEDIIGVIDLTIQKCREEFEKNAIKKVLDKEYALRKLLIDMILKEFGSIRNYLLSLGKFKENGFSEGFAEAKGSIIQKIKDVLEGSKWEQLPAIAISTAQRQWYNRGAQDMEETWNRILNQLLKDLESLV